MVTCTVELTDASDLVAMAHCIALDAEAFPYASAQFGSRSASGRLWIARAEWGIVGFLAARLRSSAMHVEGVAVDVACRRQGVGRALVRAAVAHAREAGARAVALHVSVTNVGAIALYEGESFVITRTLRDFYPPHAFGGERRALQMMRLVQG